MNNLQLYITKKFDEYQNMLEINPQEAIKQQVCDVSSALETITYNKDEINFFYLLRYTNEGVFVVILRTIPDQATDHLAAWIFVPSTLNVPGEDLGAVVDTLVDIITNSRITSEQYDVMRSLFAKEYEPIPTPGATAANRGDRYAYRYFGEGTGYELSDFMGNKRYQTTYLPYAGVILADKKNGVSIRGINLTDAPLEQMVKIFPPKLSDTTYSPQIFGQPFDKPYLVPLMGTVEILWESPVAVDVRQSIMISKPNQRPDPISAATVPVTSEPELPPAPQPEAASTPEAVIPAPAEETPVQKAPEAPVTDDTHQEAPLNTTETTQLHQLPEDNAPEQPAISHDRQHLYNFVLPAKSADISGLIKFEVHTRTPLTESPIDGYELSDTIQEGPSRHNHLIYTPTGGLWQKLLYGLAGLLIGVLLTLLCKCTSTGTSTTTDDTAADTDTIETVEVPQETPATDNATKPAADQAKTSTATDTSLEAAVRYLDTNKQWDKAELEQYPDLKGLYNDMNTFNKKRLIDYWKPKLKDSRTFGTIAKHASLGMKKTPRTPAGQTTFNKANESVIKVQSYLNTIDP